MGPFLMEGDYEHVAIPIKEKEYECLITGILNRA